MDNATTTAARLPSIPPGTRCRFGAGVVRAYPEGGDRYEVVAEDDWSHRLGVLREQLEVLP